MRQLPEHPDLDQLRHQARDLQRASTPPLRLAEAQLLLAREYGFSSWAKLKAEVAGRAGAADEYAIRPVASLEELTAAFDLLGAQLDPPLTHAHRSFSRLVAHAQGDRRFMLVVEHRGRLVGGLLTLREDDRLNIRLLAVVGPHRGRGLARRLMQALEEEARRQGVTGLFLGGASREEKLLYQRFGFVVGRSQLIGKSLPPSIEWRRARLAAMR